MSWGVLESHSCCNVTAMCATLNRNVLRCPWKSQLLQCHGHQLVVRSRPVEQQLTTILSMKVSCSLLVTAELLYFMTNVIHSHYLTFRVDVTHRRQPMLRPPFIPINQSTQHQSLIETITYPGTWSLGTRCALVAMRPRFRSMSGMPDIYQPSWRPFAMQHAKPNGLALSLDLSHVWKLRNVKFLRVCNQKHRHQPASNWWRWHPDL